MASNSNGNDKTSRFSCQTRASTMEWLEAIASILTKYQFLWSAHVVDFFQGRLWEAVDKDWMDCLKQESVQNLLHLPSGLIQDNWPASLKELIRSAESLAFPRNARTSLQMHFPGLSIPYIGNVLAQGMNSKKRHEVEVLASVIQRIAIEAGAHCIIDVGSGQGHLAQVLSFEYQFPVIALDASLHHATVTNERTERIKRHYQARMRNSHLDHHHLHVPQTVTSQVLCSESLVSLSKALGSSLSTETNSYGEKSAIDDETNEFKGTSSLKDFAARESADTFPYNMNGVESSLVLSGLHACGDLSVTMLRAFLESEEVKALISIGCCYNLLSEQGDDNELHCHGFPMSKGVANLGIHLGRNGRDLACQSAARWKSLTVDDALKNFEVHALRSAFQMVLKKYYPEVLESNPSVGRLGKARRRKKRKDAFIQAPFTENVAKSSSLVDSEVPCLRTGWSEKSISKKIFAPVISNELMLKHAGKSAELVSSFEALKIEIPKENTCENDKAIVSDLGESSHGTCTASSAHLRCNMNCAKTSDLNKVDKSIMFKEYSTCALERLGLPPVPVEEVHKIWRDLEDNMVFFLFPFYPLTKSYMC
ncbi:hypothetical protein SUGI_0940170 [Cryptomeria japonica]|nr:hypothetical protein SUGI_0940170 [Cryptomeria japonica]